MKKITITKQTWSTFLTISSLILIAFVFWALSGCKTCDPVVIVKDSIRTEIKAVPVEVPVFYQDSTYALLWLQCNENNEVIVKQSEFYKGKYTDVLGKLEAGKLTFKTKTIIKDSILYISRDTNTYASHKEVVKVNELTKGQQRKITLFWCLLVADIMLFLALLVWLWMKFKSKLKNIFK